MKKQDTQALLVGGAIILGLYLLSKRGSGLSGLDSRDISRNEDLAWGVAHLISLEEHCAESYSMTGDPTYLTSLKHLREERRKTMARLLPADAPGQTWCIAKHFLGGAMRFYETGSKYLTDGDSASASEMFDLSRRMKDSAMNVTQMKLDAPQCSVCKGG